MNIVALGTVACNIAKKFGQYQYKIYQIDDCFAAKKSRYFLKVPKCGTIVEYEANTSSTIFEKFFKGIKGEIIFIVCGSEKISSLSLIVLQQLSKYSHVTVLYVRPDKMFLSEEKKQLENIVFKTLQEYAIHDFLEQIYLLDNSLIENVAKDINIQNYYDKINDVIVWFMHTISYYEKQEALMDNFSIKENYGIKTIGIKQLDDEVEEKLLFSLDKVREKRYYYILNKEQLESNKVLLEKAKEDIKEKIQEKNCKVSYGIYSSDLKENMIISILQSMEVQK